MPLALRVAFRFLIRSTKQSRSVTLFTAISVMGIACSVMLFLLIDSLVNGLSVNLRQTLVGFESPNFIQVAQNEVELTEQQLLMFAHKNPEYKLQKLYLKEFDGLMKVPLQNPTGIKVRSVNQDFFKIKESQIKIFWQEGFDAKSFSESDDLVLLGENVYHRLKFLPGEDEEILLTHPFADLGPSGEVEPSERLLKVAGLFATGRVDFDDVFVLVPEPVMYQMGNEALLKKTFYLFPDRLDQSHSLQLAWNQKGRAVMASWRDKNQNIIKAMELEKLMYFFIFVFVLLISAFNLAGVIAIFALSKSEDTAILRTLGLSPAFVRTIYMVLGSILGSVGCLLGLAMALGLIYLFDSSGFTLPRAYGFTKLPIALNPKTLWGLVLGTPILAALVSYVPSWRINRHSVAEVLRLG